ncbi:MAG: DNA-directed RNA polymerase subunit omega [Ruminococcus sp.]|nr:DNA-directed RNA polymerase subunit omega [Ruminococcus sp.]MCD7772706.1 DNA-directed RNA polymerase subunit omega [Ruminococcus sp.]
MSKPVSATQILKNDESYYSLVLAIAKRAREITDNAVADKVILETKPVKTAIDEFVAGEYKLIEDPGVKG